MKEKVIIRSIVADDNAIMASIIRNSLKEFDAAKPGTVYFDDSTDHLYSVFKKEKSAYFIAEINNEVAGGAGFYPTPGLDEGVCELVKMYVSSKYRGNGTGKLLLEKCMAQAKINGFRKMYIETMPELVNAIAMYKKNGFTHIPSSQGNSGHTGCDVFMIRSL